MDESETPSELIDIGANLTHESFASDLPLVLDRARAADVVTMIVTGASVEESAAARALAQAHPQLYATAGVHPHLATQWDERSADALRALVGMGQVVAIGETGLDFNRDFSPRPVQERVFECQLDLAAELGLPVFMHERDAHRRFLSILAQHRARLSAVVVHCFTGDTEQLKNYLDLDAYIGITGWICDERRGMHLREAVRAIPLERLMLETDAPYLLPRDLTPKPKHRRNEPMHLAHIARVVAQCLDVTIPALARATSANARRFFGLGARAAVSDGVLR